MSASAATRLSHIARTMGVIAVVAGSLAVGTDSTHATSPHPTPVVRSVSAGAAIGPVGHHPGRLGHKVAKSHMPDSPAAARARGETRATSAGEAGIRPSTPVGLADAPRHGVRNTTFSNNWAGISATGPTGTFRGVAGDWYVPRARPTIDNRYGSTWIGVDGNGSRQLIQTGAEEDSINGKPFYAAWWEILPAAETKIYLTSGALAPVAPGDFMYSYIYQTSPGVYRIFLDDVTQNWYYDQAHYYSGPGVSSEWIQEASTLGTEISHPINFGTASFGWMYVDENNTWYRTNFGANTRMDIAQGTTRYTSTAVPTQTAPQTFTVSYIGP